MCLPESAYLSVALRRGAPVTYERKFRELYVDSALYVSVVYRANVLAALTTLCVWNINRFMPLQFGCSNHKFDNALKTLPAAFKEVWGSNPD